MTGKKSHATAVLASRAHLVYRVNGESNGKHYWAYALINQTHLNAFNKAIESGQVHVQDYGKVLAWGVGEEPPESVRKELKLTYNFDIIA